MWFACVAVLFCAEASLASLWPWGDLEAVRVASQQRYRERLEPLRRFCESGSPEAQMVRDARSLHLSFSSHEFRFYGCLRPKVGI